MWKLLIIDYSYIFLISIFFIKKAEFSFFYISPNFLLLLIYYGLNLFQDDWKPSANENSSSSCQYSPTSPHCKMKVIFLLLQSSPKKVQILTKKTILERIFVRSGYLTPLFTSYEPLMIIKSLHRGFKKKATLSKCNIVLYLFCCWGTLYLQPLFINQIFLCVLLMSRESQRHHIFRIGLVVSKLHQGRGSEPT